jgi:serine/threonine protein kinase/tetratricopeptide (TPR) repeat protein
MNDDAILAAALTRPNRKERTLFLQQVCGHDPAMLQRIEALLQAHENNSDAARADGSAPGQKEPETTKDAEPEPGEVVELGKTRLGAYKLLQRIGKGGMGVVYLAEQERPVRRRVAVKLIKPGMDSAHIIARFEAERQALALMNHPNIAKVFDAGTTARGHPYFVMELVPGVPITKYCDDHRLTVRARVELLVPVCHAIQHAHQKGVIHRDVKPSNILVSLHDGKPMPKVIDFGVAKAMEQPLTEHTIYTQYGQVLGTVEYMSPEQAEMGGLGVDTRSDVFSLGVALYELLTGTTPLSHRRLRELTVQQQVQLIKDEDPPKPSTRLGSADDTLPTLAARRSAEPTSLLTLVRGDLDWIVMKALEKDRGRRYESPAAMVRDIERYLRDEPVEACPPSAIYRLRKFGRRNRWLITTAALVTVLLVGGIITSTLLAVRARLAEKDARVQRDAAESAEREARQERDQAIEAREHMAVAEEQAKTQAAIAGAVNDFLLKDLLAQADVANQVGLGSRPDKDLKLRTMLDRAAESAPRRFANRPLVEAAVDVTLGNAYMGVGEYQAALRQLGRAYELRSKALGDQALPTLEAMNDLAVPCILENQLNRAETLLLSVVPGRRRQLGANHPDTLKSTYLFAGLRLKQGRSTEAESLLTDVLDTQVRRLGDGHPDTLASMSLLAELYLLRMNFAKAESLYTRALESSRRWLGEEHPDTVQHAGRLAFVYFNMGAFDKAEPLLLKSMEMSRSVLGLTHPATLGYAADLAALYRRQGRRGEAETLLAETLQQQRRALGERDLQTISSMLDLGDLYQEEGKLAEAEKLFREAVHKQRSDPNVVPIALASALSMLGNNLMAQDKYADAEPFIRECLAIRERELRDHWQTSSTMNLLGGCLLGQKRYTEAEALLLRANDGFDRHKATMPPTLTHRVKQNLKWLVQLYDAWGKPEKAQRWRKQSIASTPAPGGTP